jgi:hypothetical protein
MKRIFGRLKAFARHPVTQLAAGIVLLVSGGYEVVQDFMTAERSLRPGVHHGVALYGLIQILGSLPEVIEGLDRTFEAVDKRHEVSDFHKVSPTEKEGTR